MQECRLEGGMPACVCPGMHAQILVPMHAWMHARMYVIIYKIVVEGTIDKLDQTWGIVKSDTSARTYWYVANVCGLLLTA